MKIDAHVILIVLSILVVLSYVFNYLSATLRIPSVLLLIASGIGLNFLATYTSFQMPPTRTLLEILGITGLIFIVLEAAMDLSIERKKLKLIGRALLSAAVLLGFTSVVISFIFIRYYHVNFQQALLHAIPLSVISSAIAIPSVRNLSEAKREFVIYESTFSDILGIILFNFVLVDHDSGIMAVVGFSWEMVLIFFVSIISTGLLIFLLNHSTSHVRFFLTFAVLILTYSLVKFLHLPSLILVLFFGLVLNNFKLLDYPVVHKYFSFERLNEVTKEMKLMTAETAFIIRTFFFLLFGYSINLHLLLSKEVLIMGLVIITITIILRFVFLKYFLKISSAPLTLMAPRGLITILLFYSIPENQRLHDLSEGVLFIVIVFTSLMMTVGLLFYKQTLKERIEDVI